MANRNLISAVGLTIYVNLRKDDGSDDIYDNNSSDVVNFDVSDYADYGVDLSVTGSGGTKYVYTIPAELPAGRWIEEFRRQAGGARDADTAVDIILRSRRFTWNGGVVTGSPSVGTNQTTVNELRSLLQNFARFAGINTTWNTDPYTLSNADYVIQNTLNTVIRRTKCTQQTDSVTQGEGDDQVVFNFDGFAPERIIRIWAVPADGSNLSGYSPSIDVIDLERIDAFRRAYGGQTGHPGAIGFSLQDGTNNTARTADQDYTIKVNWWPTLTAWDIGDESAGTEVINMPGDIAREAIELGGVLRLQGQQVEHLPVTDRRRADWEAFISRNMGAGNLGARSFRRTSLTESEALRAERPW